MTHSKWPRVKFIPGSCHGLSLHGAHALPGEPEVAPRAFRFKIRTELTLAESVPLLQSVPPKGYTKCESHLKQNIWSASITTVVI